MESSEAARTEFLRDIEATSFKHRLQQTPDVCITSLGRRDHQGQPLQLRAFMTLTLPRGLPSRTQNTTQINEDSPGPWQAHMKYGGQIQLHSVDRARRL